jgi:hypothetical protein
VDIGLNRGAPGSRSGSERRRCNRDHAVAEIEWREKPAVAGNSGSALKGGRGAS